jgi:ribosome-associated protein YbcJ (S4-like RNA binding protein)
MKAAGRAEKGGRLKAILDEQEITSDEQPLVRNEKRLQPAVKVAYVQPPAKPAAVAETKDDGYESCLDIAAQFLARG